MGASTLRIESIRASQPATPEAPRDWRTSLGQILVTIETDDGLTGYGVGGGGQASVHVTESVIGPALTGQDATDVEGLWDAMYSLTLAYGRKGLAIMAISGVDLALWDLRAKRAGLPLAYILSDEVQSTVPAYRTGKSPEKWISEGTEGYTALKLNLGMGANEDLQDVVDRVRRVREALGPDVAIMGDAFMSLDLESALRIADGLVDVGLGWFEEPLPADDFEGYARLRDECSIPIAGGEHEYTAKAFETLMADRLHAIVQPDVCWCGGLTELVKIYRLGEQYGIRVCPHRGSEIWSLHAICALDPDPLAESGREWMTWVKDQPQIVEGEISLGPGVGFGVRIDSDGNG